MLRNYIKKRGTRYDPNNLEDAVEPVKNNSISLCKTAIKFNIKKSTLLDHVSGKHIKSTGGQQNISLQIEGLLSKWIDQVAEWGWPIGFVTLRLMVTDIFDKNGIKSKRFVRDRLQIIACCK